MIVANSNLGGPIIQQHLVEGSRPKDSRIRPPSIPGHFPPVYLQLPLASYVVVNVRWDLMTRPKRVT